MNSNFTYRCMRMAVLFLSIAGLSQAQDLSNGLVECFGFNNSVAPGSPANLMKPGMNLGLDRKNQENSALLLNDNSYLQTTGNSSDKSNVWAVSMWIKPVKPVSNYSCYMFSLGSNGGDQTILLNGNLIKVGNYQKSGFVETLNSTILSNNFYNTWHHVVAQKTNDSLQLYLDGVLNNALKTTNGTSFYGSAIQSTERIGSRYNGTGYYEGLIDEYRRYTRVLSKGEVQTLYSQYHIDYTSGSTINTSLSRFLPGDIMTDNSGNASVLSKGVDLVNDKNGVANSAYKLTMGSTFLTNTSKNTSAKFATDFWSVSMWIKPISIPETTTWSILFSNLDENYFGNEIYFYNKNLYVRHSFINTRASYDSENLIFPVPQGFVGNWQQLVVVNKRDSLLLYLNGTLAKGMKAGGNSYYGLYNISKIYLGGTISNIYCFDGLLDEYRYYSRALSKEEAKLLYTASDCTPLSIDDESVEQRKPQVYPNPVKDKLYSNLKMDSWEVLDGFGLTIKMQKGFENGYMDVEDLPSGMYFLKTTSKQGSALIKFIKE